MPVAARGRTVGVRAQAAAARALPQGMGANPLRKSVAMGRTVRRATAPTARRSAVVVEAKKVALLGAAGGIGQPLALLLKMNPQISELRLYDIMNVKGVAADLSHVNTPAQVAGRERRGARTLAASARQTQCHAPPPPPDALPGTRPHARVSHPAALQLPRPAAPPRRSRVTPAPRSWAPHCRAWTW